MDADAQSPLSVRQRRVHAAIQSVGGYWRPISGVARLLEELGELAEQFGSENTRPDRRRLSEELADLWIISTCTANQFNINLEDHKSNVLSGTPATHSFNDVVSHAGRIARIVNYYDGPKTPRSLDAWPSSLGPAIAALHTALYRLATEYDVALDEAIDEKIARIPSIDGGRFEQSYDPSTADSLHRFEAVRSTTACPYANEARLWGAPRWEPRWSLSRNVDLMLPYLISFTKAAAPERLDGFVIAIDESSLTEDMCVLANWFHTLLKTLAKKDPRPSTLYDGNIQQRGWQFSFNGLRLFISVFSPLYPPNHSRHSSAATFVVLQPEKSFDQHSIGSKFPGSDNIKQQVRRRFAEAGISYPADVIDTRIEASIYLLPRWDGDRCAVWWQDVKRPQ